MGSLQKGTPTQYRPVCLSFSSAFQHFVDEEPSERYPDQAPACLSQSLTKFILCLVLLQHFVDGEPSERYPGPLPACLSQSLTHSILCFSALCRCLQKGTPTQYRPVCRSLLQSPSCALYCCSILWIGNLQKGTLTQYQPLCRTIPRLPSTAAALCGWEPSERYPDSVRPVCLSLCPCLSHSPRLPFSTLWMGSRQKGTPTQYRPLGPSRLAPAAPRPAIARPSEQPANQLPGKGTERCWLYRGVCQ